MIAQDRMDKLDLIIEMLKSIEERLSTLEKTMKDGMEKNKIVEENCSKMREHIDFIEHTYSVIRTPLSYLKTKIEYVMGKEITQELPVLVYHTQE